MNYENLLAEYGMIQGMVGENEDGEKVIVSIDYESAEIRTFQENGWIRINVFYPDGTETETYRR